MCFCGLEDKSFRHIFALLLDRLNVYRAGAGAQVEISNCTLEDKMYYGSSGILEWNVSAKFYSNHGHKKVKDFFFVP
jgi:hypothetical protein